ncbi:hypothetical protein GCM10008164_15510 [Achromobacter xylosoxidans]|nr:hypothetical protein GCM10008164_15510 [Achromobacter xylosoxidans]
MAPGSSAGSRLMHWLWIPFMGRCRKPVAGRRDPKRSPTGASIGIPQAGRRRLKNPVSQNGFSCTAWPQQRPPRPGPLAHFPGQTPRRFLHRGQVRGDVAVDGRG